MENVTVVIKPTRNCNLRCKYCSVGEPTYHTMKKEEVAVIIEKIVTRQKDTYTKFIWHGGEPLLAGIDFYEQVVATQKPLIANGYRVTNVVQTNGTLINKTWGQFFKTHHFGIGLSIDGPKEINDLTRVFPNNIGAFDSIKRGSAILDENNIEHGFLVVINKNNAQRIDEIINFMHTENKRYKLVAVAPLGRAADNNQDVMMQGDAFADSQIRLFERWLSEGYLVDRSALWKYLVAYLTNKPIECIFQNNCQKNFIGVDCDGSVYPCGRFCGGSKMKYGNLLVDSFHKIAQHPYRTALIQRSKHLTKCNQCKYFSICSGGCPLQGMVSGDIEHEDYNCHQYYKIFSHIEKRVRELT